ncbi:MAG: MFS transporter, partial [Lentisphaeria bacterium]|nr:MFS transporter [Lentisphaeria bacterium]
IELFDRIRHDKSISLAVAWSFNQLAYAIVYPFIPLYLSNERGLPYTLVSWIFPLMGFAVILAPVPCGWMTDKLGRSFMMLFGQLGRGIIFFILAFMVFVNAPFWLFVIFLMLNTAVGVAFQIGSDAYLADISSEEERPSYYGKIRIGFNLGWAVGPMLGAFFAKTPFWLFFFMTGLLCIAGTVYTKVSCCNDIASPVKKIQKEKSSASILPEILGNRNFLLYMAGTLFLMCLASQLYSTLSIFSTTIAGVSRKALGSIYSLNGAMVLLLQLPVVGLLKKWNTPVKLQLVAGTVLYAAGYSLLGFSAGAVAVACAVAIVTLGEIAAQPALYTSIAAETRPDNAGRMFSVYSLMRGIGYSVGPWFGAQLFDNCKSPLILWGTLAGFAVAAAVVFIFTGKKSNTVTE